jgi:hypothetical protein
MKIHSLMANVGVIVLLSLLSPSLGSIQRMAEHAALSITLVEYVTKLLKKEEQS